eukprot:m.256416 g.256416  ORF g.256416 m.256416 type:complete len:77 (+) comp21562_c0_seq1:73-303(+)
MTSRGLPMLGASAVIIAVGYALMHFTAPTPEQVLNDMPEEIRKREMIRVDDTHKKNQALMEALKASANMNNEQQSS